MTPDERWEAAVKLLEPAVAGLGGGMERNAISVAISLKRIADSLDRIADTLAPIAQFANEKLDDIPF